jgi:hypothetical protein
MVFVAQAIDLAIFCLTGLLQESTECGVPPSPPTRKQPQGLLFHAAS